MQDSYIYLNMKIKYGKCQLMEKYKHVEKIESLAFMDFEKTIAHLERIAKDKKIDNETLRSNLMNSIVRMYQHHVSRS